MKIKYINSVIIFFFSYYIFLKYGGGLFHYIPATVSLGLSSVISISIFKKEYIKLYNYKIFLYLLILLLFMLLGLRETNAINYGTEKLILFIIEIILFIPIIPIVIKQINTFSFFIIFFLILYLISLYIEYGSINDALMLSNKKFRLGGTTKDLDNFHPIGIARYIGFSLIPLYLNMLSKISLSKRIIYFSIILVSLSYLFLSATRGPIFSLFFTIGLKQIFFSEKNFLRNTISVLSLILVLGYLGGNFIRNNKAASNLFSERFEDIDDEGRFGLQHDAIADFMGSPILGKGLGNYGYLYSGADVKVYPHNIFIEILYETGIIGITLFSSIIIIGLLVYKKIRNDDYSIFFYLFFIYFLTNAQFSFDISGNTLIFFFLFALLYRYNFYKKTFMLLISKQL